MVRTNNGFEIAETDLKLRGPGDIFGTKQSGLPELKHADIINDVELITKTKKLAFRLIQKDPSLSSENNTIIKNNLITNYSDNFKYTTVA
jgi:ATP-dependent DNA helicase RecG